MTAVYGCGTLRGTSTLLRRGSVQTNKPPPPIRRTASITNANRPPTPVGGIENLPPPPAFLLEPNKGSAVPTSMGVNVAETIKALTEQRHTPASPNSVRRTPSAQQSPSMIYSTSGLQQHHPQHHLSSQSIHHIGVGGGGVGQHSQTQSVYSGGQTIVSAQQQAQSPILSSFQSNAKLSYISQSGGVIYAQPSQIVPPPGSPSAVRRLGAVRSQSAERRNGDGPGGVGSNFLSALSAKLVPSLSPRTSRRHSEDLGPVSMQACGGGGTPNRKGPGQSFLDSLNAKLSNQHITPTNQSTLKASKIRQIINSRAQPDPKLCHESLMDQIKRGATLKRAKIVNDRSAPKIH